MTLLIKGKLTQLGAKNTIPNEVSQDSNCSLTQVCSLWKWLHPEASDHTHINELNSSPPRLEGIQVKIYPPDLFFMTVLVPLSKLRIRYKSIEPSHSLILFPDLWNLGILSVISGRLIHFSQVQVLNYYLKRLYREHLSSMNSCL